MDDISNIVHQNSPSFVILNIYFQAQFSFFFWFILFYILSAFITYVLRVYSHIVSLLQMKFWSQFSTSWGALLSQSFAAMSDEWRMVDATVPRFLRLCENTDTLFFIFSIVSFQLRRYPYFVWPWVCDRWNSTHVSCMCSVDLIETMFALYTVYIRKVGIEAIYSFYNCRLST